MPKSSDSISLSEKLEKKKIKLLLAGVQLLGQGPTYHSDVGQLLGQGPTYDSDVGWALAQHDYKYPDNSGEAILSSAKQGGNDIL